MIRRNLAAAFLGVVAMLWLEGCGTNSTQKPSDLDNATRKTLKLELSDSPLAVTFVNIGKEPIRLLKPLDGSEWCWIMPYYKLTVTGTSGQEVPLMSRCGNYGFPYFGTTWPDDYVLTIPPGGSCQHKLDPVHDIRVSGTYKLQFQYIFTPETDNTPGGPYPPDLWRGEASSNSISARLDPHN